MGQTYGVGRLERRYSAPADVGNSTRGDATTDKGGTSVDTIVEEEYEVEQEERHYRTPSGGDVFETSTTYNFTVREKCIPHAPQNARRRRSSTLLIDFIGQKLGGNFSREPEDMVDGSEDNPICKLSVPTQHVLRQAFQDIHPSELVDYHMHLVGHGDSGSGCYLHRSTKSWRYPFRRIKTAVFMAAAQVPDMQDGDIQYISRLVRLVKHYVPANIINPAQHGYLHGKFCLLPFDELYEKDGTPNRNLTTLYVPNDYSFTLSREFPEYFLPVGSVNPYRKDALQELERCAENKVTIIKWLPNSMGINPSDKECIPFYNKMKELNMILLVHAGEEHSVDAAFIDNRLGNPLFLRRPLDCGVKVIAAHCATEGYAADLDNNNVSVPCFHLFMRLMHEDRYKDLFYGDISAVCAFKRVVYLQQLLQATDIHHRLVNGSDYPVPAINLVVHTSKLLRNGFITREECAALNELYDFNPLLFDYVCKRLVQGPGGERFPASVFKAHPALSPCRKETTV